MADKSKQTLQKMMVDPTPCAREEVNESVTTLYCGNNVQEKFLNPPAPPPAPLTPPAPPAPPAPPLEHRAPSVGSFPTPVQYLRYSINTDLLKEMTKQLRKPDNKNIRKIPIRTDIKIAKNV